MVPIFHIYSQKKTTLYSVTDFSKCSFYNSVNGISIAVSGDNFLTMTKLKTKNLINPSDVFYFFDKIRDLSMSCSLTGKTAYNVLKTAFFEIE